MPTEDLDNSHSSETKENRKNPIRYGSKRPKRSLGGRKIDKSPDSTGMVVFSTLVTIIPALFFGFSLTVMEVFKKDFSKYENSKFVKIFFKGNIKSFFNLAVTIIFCAAIIGAIIVNNTSVFGKKAISVSLGLYLIGYLILGRIHPISYIIGRILIGIAIGINSSTISSYLLLIAPPEYRGGLVCLFSLSHVSGTVIFSFLNIFFKDNNNFSRILLIVLPILSSLGLISSFFILEKERTIGESKGLTELFQESRAIRSIVTVFIIRVLRQLSGISCVICFANQLFACSPNPSHSSFFLSVINLTSTGIAILIVSYINNKLILMSSILAAILGYLYIINGENQVFGVYIFMSGFGLGIGPLIWFITGQIFPYNYQKAGYALAAILTWSTNFIISFSFNHLYDWIKGYTFLVFGVCMFILLIYSSLFIPETKNRSPDFIKKEECYF